MTYHKDYAGVGKSIILVPLPHDDREGHCVENAT